MKIHKKCGGELENSLRSRFIELCSTEEYINSLENIVTRTKIGRNWKKLDINEQRKCQKCGGIGHLANNVLKKAKINEIVETKDHNDKEVESSASEKGH
ncbi:hypothetical protein O181_089777 [Austropuccinia psidii MF-1]|uniref:Uncharacterized protein n=1 Tax=Austropuccinia psidii MF-1 TaxID=1389203 RepID=A0A9Q3IU33_9BASI|nr:hypothetical protein [Austropuccinia psidii MF-1]